MLFACIDQKIGRRLRELNTAWNARTFHTGCCVHLL
jgi:hypothetical protein